MMKVLLVLAMLGVSSAAVEKKDRTITKVVKLLQDMLDKSKKEGDEETAVFAKFKCYCDTSTAEKQDSIKEATEQVALLESQIEEIRGASGELSGECAQLKADIAENVQARKDATSLRNKENKAFLAEEQDLTNGIEQMKNAIEVLTSVGADQTSATGADNKQFMAGHKGSLLSLKSEVQSALAAASALMSPDQKTSVASFLQAPFTGTYTSQSAQVMGILKSMRDTFKANLADGRATEKVSKTAHDSLIEVKEGAFKTMSKSYSEKQKDLGSNDGDLASKKKMFSTTTKQLASDEEFLSKLTPMCATKATAYDNRKLLRANEEAAIAEAVSILNSDSAFETFATSSATSSGKTSAFIQVHDMSGQARSITETMLQKAAQETKSDRLLEIAGLLKAGNPFDTVLVEITKMIKLSAEEEKADTKKLSWCNSERKNNKDSLGEKKTDILALESSIDKLSKTISAPITGLKALIQESDTKLVQNKQGQTSETTDRTAENVLYQKDVKNLVDAQSVLGRAIKVLGTYYKDLEKKLADGEALVQEDPKAPDTWKENSYSGQKGKGSEIIDMLTFIEKETQKEETTAHADEEKAQADYEDSMTDLKKQESDLEKSIVSYQQTLAEKEQDLLEAQEDLQKTTADKEAIEVYLSKIKPGCDFITTNFDLRSKNRATETAALNKATTMIKATPAYKTAVNSATVESYGACKTPCVADSSHVKCKACQAEVTVPAYCAGHKGAKGC